MTDLIPTSALGGREARGVTFGELALREAPEMALASLALPKGAGRPEPFGLTLPGPGGYVSDGPVGAVWAGPDQWMICAAGRAETDFAAEASQEAPGAYVTEQTDGFVAFEITGPSARLEAMLERLVNLPLAKLGPGCGVRTGVHHMTVFVLRPDAARVIFLGMRSAAESLWRVLEETAQR